MYGVHDGGQAEACSRRAQQHRPPVGLLGAVDEEARFISRALPPMLSTCEGKGRPRPVLRRTRGEAAGSITRASAAAAAGPQRDAEVDVAGQAGADAAPAACSAVVKLIRSGSRSGWSAAAWMSAHKAQCTHR